MSRGIRKKHESISSSDGELALAAIGLESEFTVLHNGIAVKPEILFGDPRAFIRGPLMHRTGTSYHLPTGGAVYFDTGVIEVATPVIEIDRGCAARAGRSLWESILLLRKELDEWQRIGTRGTIRLQGFSTHYNISFDLPTDEQRPERTLQKLAKLLCFILPIPVMLLTANKRSTGIGVRPRPGRIEITADFTPEPSLMIAAATLITGIVREVMTWPSYELSELRRRRIPVVDGYHPIPHTSRKGWLAKDHTFGGASDGVSSANDAVANEPRNPFVEDIDLAEWSVHNVPNRTTMSLRQIASYIFEMFFRPIARLSDPFSFRLLARVMDGHAPSLLESQDRPETYDHVGALCGWNNLYTERTLARSRYERILMHATSGDTLRLGGKILKPIGMKGWSRVVFRDEDRNKSTKESRIVLSIDDLLGHLDNWSRKSVS